MMESFRGLIAIEDNGHRGNNAGYISFIEWRTTSQHWVTGYRTEHPNSRQQYDADGGFFMGFYGVVQKGDSGFKNLGVSVSGKVKETFTENFRFPDLNKVKPHPIDQTIRQNLCNDDESQEQTNTLEFSETTGTSTSYTTESSKTESWEWSVEATLGFEYLAVSGSVTGGYGESGEKTVSESSTSESSKEHTRTITLPVTIKPRSQVQVVINQGTAEIDTPWEADVVIRLDTGYEHRGFKRGKYKGVTKFHSQFTYHTKELSEDEQCNLSGNIIKGRDGFASGFKSGVLFQFVSLDKNHFVLFVDEKMKLLRWRKPKFDDYERFFYDDEHNAVVNMQTGYALKFDGYDKDIKLEYPDGSLDFGFRYDYPYIRVA